MTSSNVKDHSFYISFQTAKYNLDVSIMRTALTLFLVVITVVVLLNVLHLYAKCVLRRRARRNRTSHLLEIRFTDEPVNSREPPKNGLDSSIIDSLPTFPYRSSSDRVDETDAKECTVCLGTLENEEIVKVLPNCKHIYHVQCIDMWLNSNSTCPVCRTGAKPLQPTSDEVICVALPMDSSNSMTHSTEIKEGGSDESISDRLSSFRRILSRQRSDRINQQSGQSDGVEDLERQ
ncbi:RING-H2 finger protein ATL40-like [Telopea speciosissima]|uniref:RING-H2 finger protein ATL40-like n=1 Tax=Telopea speciosissima TaxID=54955 RepID=UPI001CC76F36|nr:RING-H2 finger protein ATL40-like [Telopea speciosissima]